MDFAFKMMDFVFKMMDFALKMMNFGRSTCRTSLSPWMRRLSLTRMAAPGFECKTHHFFIKFFFYHSYCKIHHFYCKTRRFCTASCILRSCGRCCEVRAVSTPCSLLLAARSHGQLDFSNLLIRNFPCRSVCGLQQHARAEQSLPRYGAGSRFFTRKSSFFP